MDRILVVNRDRHTLDGLEKITDRVTRQTITEALRHTAGNRSRAARLPGVSRPTLLAKMRKHGIT